MRLNELAPKHLKYRTAISLTWRVKADFLVGQGSSAGACGASEHQLLVVQEGSGARGAWQQQACGLQGLFVLMSNTSEQDAFLFKLHILNYLALKPDFSFFQTYIFHQLINVQKVEALLQRQRLTWNGQLYLVTSVVNWSEMVAPFSCSVTRQK